MIVRNVGSFQVERTRYASGCRCLERCLGQLGTSKRQVEVADASTDWASGLEGVTVLEKHNGRVVVAVEGDEQRVLDAARAAGRVTLFSAVQPSLAQLFRQAVQT